MSSSSEVNATRQVIRVADQYETCSTRDRAKRYYPQLLDRLDDLPSQDQVVLSFEDVEFVSPSFLDEIFVGLRRDRPEILDRLVIQGLSPFTAKRLESILQHRGGKLSSHEHTDSSKREYRLA